MTSPVVGLKVTAPAPAPSSVPSQDDDAIYQLVSDVFQREINPAVARHGGQVELIDVQDRTIVVRMKGGCQGCGMATVTLRQGIEASLRKLVPGLSGIRDLTDHTKGTNPYYAQPGH